MAEDVFAEQTYQAGIFDAHCHPTDIMDSIGRIADMKAKAITVMATRSQDQELVVEAAVRYPLNDRTQFDESENVRFVIPAFGWHPWFSHQLYLDLDTEEDGNDVDAKEHYKSILVPAPDSDDFVKSLMLPLPLSKYLKETESKLQRFPLALVGEVGLDRGFRLPEGPSPMTTDVQQKTGGDNGTYTAGSREGRRLSSHKVNMEHQKTILKAQLKLAAKYRRAVSIHSVQTHGIVFEILQDLWKDHLRPSKRHMKKKRDAEGTFSEEAPESRNGDEEKPIPYPPRICMHSYSGPKDALRLFLDHKVPAEVFFSFSECINFSSPGASKAVEVIKALPEDRILIESDFHCAGDKMDKLLLDIVKRVCEIRGWDAVQGANMLRRNWEQFIFGS